MFNKVLTATDMLGACDPAVATALELVKINQGRLYVLHVLEPSYFHECGPLESIRDFRTGEETVTSPEYKETVKAELDKRCSGRLKEYGNYQIDVVYGRPSVEIRRWARKDNVDTIVLGPHAGKKEEEKDDEFRGTRIGNTVEDVIMNTAFPVMIVNRVIPIEKLKFKRIAACVDFSAPSRHAFLFALELAKKFGSRLYVVIVSDRAVDQEKRLTEFCPVPSGVEHEYHILEGTAPHPGILNFAGMNDVDLIVMGSYSKERVEKAYVGSAVEAVSAQSSCPVCVITHPSAVKKAEK
jgi:nucleotide-binding universal stress UspA family protein